ncbi:MAG: hypothetical protein AAGH38_01485 [Pseudomonadota bacterium]
MTDTVIGGSPLYIQMGGNQQVTWRVDAQEPVSQSWRNAENGAAVYGEEAFDIAARLRDPS